MMYRTSKVIVTREGSRQIVSRAELAQSPHKEVRRGAASLRPFVFGGVLFSPIPEELPVPVAIPFDISSRSRIEVERAHAKISKREKAVAARLPVTVVPVIEAPATAVDMVSKLRKERSNFVTTFTLASALVCLLIGVLAGLQIAENPSVIAWFENYTTPDMGSAVATPICNPNSDEGCR